MAQHTFTGVLPYLGSDNGIDLVQVTKKSECGVYRSHRAASWIFSALCYSSSVPEPVRDCPAAGGVLGYTWDGALFTSIVECTDRAVVVCRLINLSRPDRNQLQANVVSGAIVMLTKVGKAATTTTSTHRTCKRTKLSLTSGHSSVSTASKEGFNSNFPVPNAHQPVSSAKFVLSRSLVPTLSKEINLSVPEIPVAVMVCSDVSLMWSYSCC